MARETRPTTQASLAAALTRLVPHDEMTVMVAARLVRRRARCADLA
ncbi:MAG: hypothetical protein M3R15_14420 [Acidobacteriota bacterium]|nr:hypothetical protein [Acidobacteriota bacterium]